MISNKQDLITQARLQAKINQFDHSQLTPSRTKLGPCIQSNGQWSFASWVKPFPMHQDYIDKMTELGNRYSNIKWLPLALPKFELGNYSEFKTIWDRESIEILKTDDPTDLAEFKGLHITSNALIDFNIHDLYIDGRMSKQQLSTETGYRQGREVVGAYTKKLYKHKFFFNIISEIMFKMPISKLSNILILETIKDVRPHREQSWVWKCPTEFRITVYGDGAPPTIYVSDIETGETLYIDLPNDTNSFCWSNGTQVYGVDYYEKPSFQIVVNAVLDTEKLKTLLDSSIAKYKDVLNYKL
jgi:hypothetical protein